jgi:hypothetical protein
MRSERTETGVMSPGRKMGLRVLQCRLFRHVVLDIFHGLTYEILGIRPLLIDKLSSILIPKYGALLPRKDPAY